MLLNCNRFLVRFPPLLAYDLSNSLLVFCRKDLCDARPKPKMSLYFQMRCTLRWADPPHKTQWQQMKYYLIYVFSEIPFKMVGRIRSSFQMRCTLRWADLPAWHCHWQQIKYWLIYVCSESPFETVIFITALHCVKLYILSFGVELLER